MMCKSNGGCKRWHYDVQVKSGWIMEGIMMWK